MEELDEDYIVEIYDDRMNIMFIQAILQKRYEQVYLHAEKLKMFFGFNTTYKIRIG